jgi:glycerol-1-phosphate dehydrogenase [NAD(P)+]
MIFASGAIYRLPELLEGLGVSREMPLLAVMDATEMRRGGDSLKPLLLEILRIAGWKPEPLVLAPSPDGQVHTDERQIEAVKSRLRPGTAVLSVGSGVVTDITKHACYLFTQEGGGRLPFLVYQTANSVSAYTSSMAPVFVHGVKRTLHSRYPDALVCDLETLRDAPYEMTAAGVGDLLAATVSLPDWYLAHRLEMDESYTELPVALTGDIAGILLASAADIRQRTLKGMSLLAKLISLGGLTMSLAGATTPMSGYEHVISHVLDLIHEKKGEPLPLHGSQAALAALLGCQAYQAFLDDFEPRAVDLAGCFPEAQDMRAMILAEFAALDPSGKAGAECWADYRLKLEMWHARGDAVRRFLGEWEQEKSILRRMTCPPKRLSQALATVEAPLRFSQLDPPVGEPEARFAFFNAPLMRRRLTLGDALIFFGLDRQRIWQDILSAGWI